MEIKKIFQNIIFKGSVLGLPLVVLMSAQPLKAGPLHEIFGSGKPEYHRHINKKFLEFYEKNFFNFSKKMDKEDYQFVTKCLDQISMWSRHLPDGTGLNKDNSFPLSPLRISLTLKDKKISYGKIAVACPSNNTSDFKSFEKIAKKYKIDLPKQVSEKNYFWFEWDLDNKIQGIYFFQDSKLVSQAYQQGRLIQEQRYSADTLSALNEKYPFLASSLYAGLKSDNGKSWIELKAFDSRFVDEKVRMDLYKILNETGMMADSMELNSSETATFFYP